MNRLTDDNTNNKRQGATQGVASPVYNTGDGGLGHSLERFFWTFFRTFFFLFEETFFFDVFVPCFFKN